MKIIEFSPNLAKPIEVFNSVSASSLRLGDGSGEVHIYCIYFESGSQIGKHPTGYGQLFLVMNGEGWVAGSDGERIKLKTGQGAFFERGELHSKGSDIGMTVIMIQVSNLEPKL
jgi:quercetin dioxygenase-like cupin family protein